MNTKINKNLLTRSEAAEYLGISPGTLEVWACTKRYDLPYIKVGRSVRYSLEDLNAFIERRRHNSPRGVGA